MSQQMCRATGQFDVSMKPEALSETATGAQLGRFSLDKRFHGALDAASKGEMLSAATAVPGSAGYVAIERVDGNLDGKSGSFLLQHSGTMQRGAPSLSLSVIPDSGTGQLLGLTGRMAVRLVDGKHFYEFDYCCA